MKETIQIPYGPEAVTADWLSAVLRDPRPNRNNEVETIQIQQLMSQGILGHIYRLTPIYCKPETGQVQSMILKFPLPDLEFRKGMAGANRNEIRFYQQLADQAGISTARVYYAGFNEETYQSVLLMEDLSTDGRPGCLACGCSLIEAEAAILQLAKFHAHWWQAGSDKQLAWLGSKKEWALSAGQAEFPKLLAWFYQKMKAEMPGYALPEEFRAMGAWFLDHYVPIKQMLYGSYQTLVHDDFHLANMFFRESTSHPEPVLLDWHFLTKANGVGDLGYFMGMCLAEEQRQEAEDDFIHLYYETLTRNGVLDYPFDQFLKEYHLSSIEPFERLLQAIFALDQNKPQSLEFFQAILDRLIPYVTNRRIKEFIA